MTLSEMKRILAEGSIQLTKSLGQNFMHDGNQIRRILRSGLVSKQDKVLEVGPGLGPLTEQLVMDAGEVLAIEKDRRLFTLLHQRMGETKNLTLIHDDAIDYLERENRDWSDWKLVGNLPYSVASLILVQLALSVNGPVRMTTTLQMEVAQRLASKVGDADYGILSLLVQFRYEPIEIFKIPSTCFHPEPDVESGCVTLLRREGKKLSANEIEQFRVLVKLAFSQRRKMMIKLLKTRWPARQLESAFGELGLSLQARAEMVSLEQFIRLASLLDSEKD